MPHTQKEKGSAVSGPFRAPAVQLFQNPVAPALAYGIVLGGRLVMFSVGMLVTRLESCLRSLLLKSFLTSAAVLILSFGAFAVEPNKTIPVGSKIYIEAADGFDMYLTAALQKKRVPVSVVDNKEKADYQLSGVSDHQKAGWAKTVFLGQIHSDEQAGVKLVDIKTGEVVFAYAVNKKNSLHGRQTAAEACAKHMKESVAKN